MKNEPAMPAEAVDDALSALQALALAPATAALCALTGRSGETTLGHAGLTLAF